MPTRQMRPRGESPGLQQGIALRIGDVEVAALAAVPQADPFVGVHQPFVVGQPGPFWRWLLGQPWRWHGNPGGIGQQAPLVLPVARKRQLGKALPDAGGDVRHAPAGVKVLQKPDQPVALLEDQGSWAATG